MEKTGEKRLTVKDADTALLITCGSWLFLKFVLKGLPLFQNHPVFTDLFGKVILVLPGICFLIVKRVDTMEFLEVRKPSGYSLGMGILALICSYPLMILLSELSMKFVASNVDRTIGSLLAMGLVPAILFAAILPALCEEFVFRGILYHTYRHQSIIKGAVFSALAFGLMHLNLHQMPYAFVSGILFALIDEASGSILVSVCLHFLVNLTSVLAGYFTGIDSGGGTADSGAFTMGEIIFFLILSVIMCFLVVRVLRKTAEKNGRRLSGSADGEAEGHVLHPLYLIFAAVAVFVILLTIQPAG